MILVDMDGYNDLGKGISSARTAIICRLGLYGSSSPTSQYWVGTHVGYRFYLGQYVSSPSMEYEAAMRRQMNTMGTMASLHNI